MILFYLFLHYIFQVRALFRPYPIFLGDQTPKWSSRYEDYVLRPHEIRLVFEKPKNNGFYVNTVIEYDQRNDVSMKDPTKQLILYPTHYNNTRFISEYNETEYFWTNLKNYTHKKQTREIWV